MLPRVDHTVISEAEFAIPYLLLESFSGSDGAKSQ